MQKTSKLLSVITIRVDINNSVDSRASFYRHCAALLVAATHATALATEYFGGAEADLYMPGCISQAADNTDKGTLKRVSVLCKIR